MVRLELRLEVLLGLARSSDIIQIKINVTYLTDAKHQLDLLISLFY